MRTCGRGTLGGFLCVLATAGCGGHTGADGSGAQCEGPAPCGGNLEGTWQVDSLCVEGDLAAALNALPGTPSACNTMVQSASEAFHGTVTYANGTETIDVTADVVMEVLYTPACYSATAGVPLSAGACSYQQQQLVAQSGYTAACQLEVGGCRCSASKQSQSTQVSSYTVSGSRITYTDGDDPMDYCVSGTTLTERQTAPDLGGLVAVLSLHRAP